MTTNCNSIIRCMKGILEIKWKVKTFLSHDGIISKMFVNRYNWNLANYNCCKYNYNHLNGMNEIKKWNETFYFENVVICINYLKNVPILCWSSLVTRRSRQCEPDVRVRPLRTFMRAQPEECRRADSTPRPSKGRRVRCRETVRPRTLWTRDTSCRGSRLRPDSADWRDSIQTNLTDLDHKIRYSKNRLMWSLRHVISLFVWSHFFCPIY